MHKNSVTLRGIVENLEYSHESKGIRYYKGQIKVRRLSGKVDIIPIIVKEYILNRYLGGLNLLGEEVSVVGSFRSRNEIVDSKYKLLLYVHVYEFTKEVLETNTIELEGVVCKEVLYRTTPSNKEIADVFIAVNREHDKSDYIPCIIWGRLAGLAEEFNVGDTIKLKGRIQSREYNKDGQTRVAYEVSASEIERADN